MLCQTVRTYVRRVLGVRRRGQLPNMGEGTDELLLVRRAVISPYGWVYNYLRSTVVVVVAVVARTVSSIIYLYVYRS